MIRSEHVREDVKKFEDTKEIGLREVVHAMSLVAKILLDIRQNQVAIMKNQGIKLLTGRKEAPRTEEDKGE